MTELAAISQRIWDMKYRHRQAGGAPVDNSVEDSWRRVANALAEMESRESREAWRERFYAALEGFRFLPAGRILAGAGTSREVTLFNCFVMGTIPDDMGGIFAHLREAALTLQQGGGIGYDFSSLRPKGALVRGVGADASGPLSFMDVWDAMCRTIMSAGSRRGAMMGTLRCDHPDIEDFVTAKRDPNRLRMFNVSVLVTDAFVQAVREDASWDLVFGGEVYRTIRARHLWQQIMESTHAQAEPGVIFIDRINQTNNLWYCEEIQSTNPCVTADTWVHTSQGPRQVSELLDRPFEVLVNGKAWPTGPDGFFSTGRKQIRRLVTREGNALRLTPEHPVLRVTRRTRYSLETAWVPVGEQAPEWPGPHGEGEGYLLGLLVGDGTLKSDKAVISAWPGRMACHGGYERPGAADVMAAAMKHAKNLSTRADFGGWVAVPERGEFRLSLGAVKALAQELDLAPGAKTVTPAIERQSSAFYRGFLRGLFDADGTVLGTQEKGVSVRLAQSDLDHLRAVQRMLLRLGIVARIYRNRRPEGTSMLPDGKGGQRAYPVRAQHELVIAGENMARYQEHIGFSDGKKADRLATALGGYRRRQNRERFLATVDSVIAEGEDVVYDVRVPGVNAFDANGLTVHNCGEQPLPPYGACLLGSINLARLVKRPFEPDAELDLDELQELVPTAVRMLDDAIDASRFPLEQQREEARAKRRIGLGITGLADALIMCGLTYGSKQAVAATERWLHALRRGAYLASVDLAKERGAFPLFDKEKFLQGHMVRQLDDDVREAIAAHGIRNGVLTSVAPTGTISILANNVSSGLEPVYSLSYSRTVLMPDGTRRKERVRDFALEEFRRIKGADAELPEAFVDAQRLSPSAHVVMQAAVQKYIDASVSKTINVPADIGFEAFKDVYMQAYEMGCKGCTTYRPNPVTGAVLETGEAAGTTQADGGKTAEAVREAGPAAARGGDVVFMTEPLQRPEVLPGRTYKLKWPESDHAIYITLNDVVQDGRRRPFEIFINSKNMEHYAWTVALTRMISAVFRRGGDVSFVVEELKAVFDPRGGAWLNGRYKPSLLAAIGEVIEQHMIDIGFLSEPADVARRAKTAEHRKAVGEGAGAIPRQCPKCGAAALIEQEGCDLCTSCGYSRCG